MLYKIRLVLTFQVKKWYTTISIMKKTAVHRAHAKINLALSVTGVKGGMHTIDSLVTNIGVYDTINATKRADSQIKVDYWGLTEGLRGDTAKRMAELIQNRYGTAGADILITKRIPMSAGLGGSSADAAGVAHCMRTLYNLGDIPADLLLAVGSDVPYMYEGGDKRISGTGERLESVFLQQANYAVLVCPGGVSTAEAYALYDKIGGQNPDIDKILDNMRLGKPYILTNALQKAAAELNHNITTGLELLARSGFENTVMSGSGSSVIGVTADKKKHEQNCDTLKKLLPRGYILL
jgi:4-diphosphocytidyl-2-C-methyl-D-erythritol kinase